MAFTCGVCVYECLRRLYLLRLPSFALLQIKQQAAGSAYIVYKYRMLYSIAQTLRAYNLTTMKCDSRLRRLARYHRADDLLNKMLDRECDRACRVVRSLGASTCVHSVFCYDRLYGHLTYHIDFVIEPKTPNSHHHTDAITVMWMVAP